MLPYINFRNPMCVLHVWFFAAEGGTKLGQLPILCTWKLGHVVQIENTIFVGFRGSKYGLGPINIGNDVQTSPCKGVLGLFKALRPAMGHTY